MRYYIILLGIILIVASCKKDQFNTVPKISFLSLSPSSWQSTSTAINGPWLKFQLNDKEGDFGFQDTSISYVYVKRFSTGLSTVDSFSFPFPNLPIADKSNLDVEVTIDLNFALPPRAMRPRVDTIFYEFYVKDFAGNKSNVLRNPEPFLYVTP
jgi:hypothetical protein